MFSLIITERTLVCNITTPTLVAFFWYSTGGCERGNKGNEESGHGPKG